MTEDTSGRLWIWVVGWDKFQLRKQNHAGYPWFKVYSELTSNDDWNELSTANRCLLIGIWSDTNRLGLGRVSANITALRGRHSCRRASLEPLVQAGFIEVSSTQGAKSRHDQGTPEQSRTTSYKDKEEERARSAANGGASRSEGDPPHLGDTELAERLAQVNREMGGPA